MRLPTLSILRTLFGTPDERIPAKDALKHPWFHDLHKMEQNMRRRNRGSSSRSAIEGSGSSSPVSKLGSGSSKSLLNDHREKADKDSGDKGDKLEKDSGDKSAKETDGMAGDKDGGEKEGFPKGPGSSLPTIGASSSSTKGDHAQRDGMRGFNAHAADSMPRHRGGRCTGTNQDSSENQNSMSKHGSSTHSLQISAQRRRTCMEDMEATQSARRGKEGQRKDRKEEHRKHRSKKNKNSRSYGSSRRAMAHMGLIILYKMQGAHEEVAAPSLTLVQRPWPRSGSGTYSYSYGSSRSLKYGYPSYRSSIVRALCEN